jgi:hypothetical protein
VRHEAAHGDDHCPHLHTIESELKKSEKKSVDKHVCTMWLAAGTTALLATKWVAKGIEVKGFDQWHNTTQHKCSFWQERF